MCDEKHLMAMVKKMPQLKELWVDSSSSIANRSREQANELLRKASGFTNRYAACKRAGLTELPVSVREYLEENVTKLPCYKGWWTADCNRPYLDFLGKVYDEIVRKKEEAKRVEAQAWKEGRAWWAHEIERYRDWKSRGSPRGQDSEYLKLKMSVNTFPARSVEQKAIFAEISRLASEDQITVDEEEVKEEEEANLSDEEEEVKEEKAASLSDDDEQEAKERYTDDLCTRAAQLVEKVRRDPSLRDTTSYWVTLATLAHAQAVDRMECEAVLKIPEKSIKTLLLEEQHNYNDEFCAQAAIVMKELESQAVIDFADDRWNLFRQVSLCKQLGLTVVHWEMLMSSARHPSSLDSKPWGRWNDRQRQYLLTQWLANQGNPCQVLEAMLKRVSPKWARRNFTSFTIWFQIQELSSQCPERPDLQERTRLWVKLMNSTLTKEEKARLTNMQLYFLNWDFCSRLPSLVKQFESMPIDFAGKLWTLEIPLAQAACEFVGEHKNLSIIIENWRRLERGKLLDPEKEQLSPAQRAYLEALACRRLRKLVDRFESGPIDFAGKLWKHDIPRLKAMCDMKEYTGIVTIIDNWKRLEQGQEIVDERNLTRRQRKWRNRDEKTDCAKLLQLLAKFNAKVDFAGQTWRDILKERKGCQQPDVNATVDRWTWLWKNPGAIRTDDWNAAQIRYLRSSLCLYVSRALDKFNATPDFKSALWTHLTQLSDLCWSSGSRRMQVQNWRAIEVGKDVPFPEKVNAYQKRYMDARYCREVAAALTRFEQEPDFGSADWSFLAESKGRCPSTSEQVNNWNRLQANDLAALTGSLTEAQERMRADLVRKVSLSESLTDSKSLEVQAVDCNTIAAALEAFETEPVDFRSDLWVRLVRASSQCLNLDGALVSIIENWSLIENSDYASLSSLDLAQRRYLGRKFQGEALPPSLMSKVGPYMMRAIVPNSGCKALDQAVKAFEALEKIDWRSSQWEGVVALRSKCPASAQPFLIATVDRWDQLKRGMLPDYLSERQQAYVARVNKQCQKFVEELAKFEEETTALFARSNNSPPNFSTFGFGFMASSVGDAVCLGEAGVRAQGTIKNWIRLRARESLNHLDKATLSSAQKAWLQRLFDSKQVEAEEVKVDPDEEKACQQLQTALDAFEEDPDLGSPAFETVVELANQCRTDSSLARRVQAWVAIKNGVPPSFGRLNDAQRRYLREHADFVEQNAADHWLKMAESLDRFERRATINWNSPDWAALQSGIDVYEPVSEADEDIQETVKKWAALRAGKEFSPTSLNARQRRFQERLRSRRSLKWSQVVTPLELWYWGWRERKMNGTQQELIDRWTQALQGDDEALAWLRQRQRQWPLANYLVDLSPSQLRQVRRLEKLLFKLEGNGGVTDAERAMVDNLMFNMSSSLNSTMREWYSYYYRRLDLCCHRKLRLSSMAKLIDEFDNAPDIVTGNRLYSKIESLPGAANNSGVAQVRSVCQAFTKFTHADDPVAGAVLNEASLKPDFVVQFLGYPRQLQEAIRKARRTMLTRPEEREAILTAFDDRQYPGLAAWKEYLREQTEVEARARQMRFFSGNLANLASYQGYLAWKKQFEAYAQRSSMSNRMQRTSRAFIKQVQRLTSHTIRYSKVVKALENASAPVPPLIVQLEGTQILGQLPVLFAYFEGEQEAKQTAIVYGLLSEAVANHEAMGWTGYLVRRWDRMADRRRLVRIGNLGHRLKQLQVTADINTANLLYRMVAPVLSPHVPDVALLERTVGQCQAFSAVTLGDSEAKMPDAGQLPLFMRLFFDLPVDVQATIRSLRRLVTTAPVSDAGVQKMEREIKSLDLGDATVASWARYLRELWNRRIWTDDDGKHKLVSFRAGGDPLSVVRLDEDLKLGREYSQTLDAALFNFFEYFASWRDEIQGQTQGSQLMNAMGTELVRAGQAATNLWMDWRARAQDKDNEERDMIDKLARAQGIWSRLQQASTFDVAQLGQVESVAQLKEFIEIDGRFLPIQIFGAPLRRRWAEMGRSMLDRVSRSSCDETVRGLRLLERTVFMDEKTTTIVAPANQMGRWADLAIRYLENAATWQQVSELGTAIFNTPAAFQWLESVKPTCPNRVVTTSFKSWTKFHEELAHFDDVLLFSDPLDAPLNLKTLQPYMEKKATVLGARWQQVETMMLMRRSLESEYWDIMRPEVFEPETVSKQIKLLGRTVERLRSTTFAEDGTLRTRMLADYVVRATERASRLLTLNAQFEGTLKDGSWAAIAAFDGSIMGSKLCGSLPNFMVPTISDLSVRTTLAAMEKFAVDGTLDDWAALRTSYVLTCLTSPFQALWVMLAAADSNLEVEGSFEKDLRILSALTVQDSDLSDYRSTLLAVYKRLWSLVHGRDGEGQEEKQAEAEPDEEASKDLLAIYRSLVEQREQRSRRLSEEMRKTELFLQNVHASIATPNTDLNMEIKMASHEIEHVWERLRQLTTELEGDTTVNAEGSKKKVRLGTLDLDSDSDSEHELDESKALARKLALETADVVDDEGRDDDDRALIAAEAEAKAAAAATAALLAKRREQARLVKLDEAAKEEARKIEFDRAISLLHMVCSTTAAVYNLNHMKVDRKGVMARLEPVVDKVRSLLNPIPDLEPEEIQRFNEYLKSTYRLKVRAKDRSFESLLIDARTVLSDASERLLERKRFLSSVVVETWIPNLANTTRPSTTAFGALLVINNTVLGQYLDTLTSVCAASNQLRSGAGHSNLDMCDRLGVAEFGLRRSLERFATQTVTIAALVKRPRQAEKLEVAASELEDRMKALGIPTVTHDDKPLAAPQLVRVMWSICGYYSMVLWARGNIWWTRSYIRWNRGWLKAGVCKRRADELYVVSVLEMDDAELVEEMDNLCEQIEQDRFVLFEASLELQAGRQVAMARKIFETAMKHIHKFKALFSAVREPTGLMDRLKTLDTLGARARQMILSDADSILATASDLCAFWSAYLAGRPGLSWFMDKAVEQRLRARCVEFDAKAQAPDQGWDSLWRDLLGALAMQLAVPTDRKNIVKFGSFRAAAAAKLHAVDSWRLKQVASSAWNQARASSSGLSNAPAFRSLLAIEDVGCAAQALSWLCMRLLSRSVVGPKINWELVLPPPSTWDCSLSVRSFSRPNIEETLERMIRLWVALTGATENVVLSTEPSQALMAKHATRDHLVRWYKKSLTELRSLASSLPADMKLVAVDVSRVGAIARAWSQENGRFDLVNKAIAYFGKVEQAIQSRNFRASGFRSGKGSNKWMDTELRRGCWARQAPTELKGSNPLMVFFDLTYKLVRESITHTMVDWNLDFESTYQLWVDYLNLLERTVKDSFQQFKVMWDQATERAIAAVPATTIVGRMARIDLNQYDCFFRACRQLCYLFNVRATAKDLVWWAPRPFIESCQAPLAPTDVITPDAPTHDPERGTRARLAQGPPAPRSRPRNGRSRPVAADSADEKSTTQPRNMDSPTDIELGVLSSPKSKPDDIDEKEKKEEKDGDEVLVEPQGDGKPVVDLPRTDYRSASTNGSQSDLPRIRMLPTPAIARPRPGQEAAFQCNKAGVLWTSDNHPGWFVDATGPYFKVETKNTSAAYVANYLAPPAKMDIVDIDNASDRWAVVRTDAPPAEVPPLFGVNAAVRKVTFWDMVPNDIDPEELFRRSPQGAAYDLFTFLFTYHTQICLDSASRVRLAWFMMLWTLSDRTEEAVASMSANVPNEDALVLKHCLRVISGIVNSNGMGNHRTGFVPFINGAPTFLEDPATWNLVKQSPTGQTLSLPSVGADDALVTLLRAHPNQLVVRFSPCCAMTLDIICYNVTEKARFVSFKQVNVLSWPEGLPETDGCTLTMARTTLAMSHVFVNNGAEVYSVSVPFTLLFMYLAWNDEEVPDRTLLTNRNSLGWESQQACTDARTSSVGKIRDYSFWVNLIRDRGGPLAWILNGFSVASERRIRRELSGIQDVYRKQSNLVRACESLLPGMDNMGNPTCHLSPDWMVETVPTDPFQLNSLMVRMLEYVDVHFYKGSLWECRRARTSIQDLATAVRSRASGSDQRYFHLWHMVRWLGLSYFADCDFKEPTKGPLATVYRMLKFMLRSGSCYPFISSVGARALLDSAGPLGQRHGTVLRLSRSSVLGLELDTERPSSDAKEVGNVQTVTVGPEEWAGLGVGKARRPADRWFVRTPKDWRLLDLRIRYILYRRMNGVLIRNLASVRTYLESCGYNVDLRTYFRKLGKRTSGKWRSFSEIRHAFLFPTSDEALDALDPVVGQLSPSDQKDWIKIKTLTIKVNGPSDSGTGSATSLCSAGSFAQIDWAGKVDRPLCNSQSNWIFTQPLLTLKMVTASTNGSKSDRLWTDTLKLLPALRNFASIHTWCVKGPQGDRNITFILNWLGASTIRWLAKYATGDIFKLDGVRLRTRADRIHMLRFIALTLIDSPAFPLLMNPVKAEYFATMYPGHAVVTLSGTRPGALLVTLYRPDDYYNLVQDELPMEMLLSYLPANSPNPGMPINLLIRLMVFDVYGVHPAILPEVFEAEAKLCGGSVQETNQSARDLVEVLTDSLSYPAELPIDGAVASRILALLVRMTVRLKRQEALGNADPKEQALLAVNLTKLYDLGMLNGRATSNPLVAGTIEGANFQAQVKSYFDGSFARSAVQAQADIERGPALAQRLRSRLELLSQKAQAFARAEFQGMVFQDEVKQKSLMGRVKRFLGLGKKNQAIDKREVKEEKADKVIGQLMREGKSAQAKAILRTKLDGGVALNQEETGLAVSLGLLAPANSGPPAVVRRVEPAGPMTSGPVFEQIKSGEYKMWNEANDDADEWNAGIGETDFEQGGCESNGTDYMFPAFTIDGNGRVVARCARSDWMMDETKYSRKQLVNLDPDNQMLLKAIRNMSKHWCPTVKHMVKLWRWLGVSCLGKRALNYLAEQALVAAEDTVNSTENPMTSLKRQALEEQLAEVQRFRSEESKARTGSRRMKDVCKGRIVFLTQMITSNILFPYVTGRRQATTLAKYNVDKVVVMLGWSKSGSVIAMRKNSSGTSREMRTYQAEDLVDLMRYTPTVVRLRVFEDFYGGICASNYLFYQHELKKHKKYKCLQSLNAMKRYAIRAVLPASYQRKLDNLWAQVVRAGNQVTEDQRRKFKALQNMSILLQTRNLDSSQVYLIEEILKWENAKQKPAKVAEMAGRLYKSRAVSDLDADAKQLENLALCQQPRFVPYVRKKVKETYPELEWSRIERMDRTELCKLLINAPQLDKLDAPVYVWQLANVPPEFLGADGVFDLWNDYRKEDKAHWLMQHYGVSIEDMRTTNAPYQSEIRKYATAAQKQRTRAEQQTMLEKERILAFRQYLLNGSESKLETEACDRLSNMVTTTGEKINLCDDAGRVHAKDLMGLIIKSFCQEHVPLMYNDLEFITMAYKTLKNYFFISKRPTPPVQRRLPKQCQTIRSMYNRLLKDIGEVASTFTDLPLGDLLDADDTMRTLQKDYLPAGLGRPSTVPLRKVWARFSQTDPNRSMQVSFAFLMLVHVSLVNGVVRMPPPSTATRTS